MFVPPAELAIEIVALIAFTALVDASRSLRLHLAIDHLGHALVGSRPVVISAAEHRVADAVQLVLAEGIVAQPVEETGRVVGRGAVVGGRDDYHGPFFG